MSEESRLERKLEGAVARASTPRGAAIVIASVTTAMTILAGGLMILIDRSHFPTLGSGMWWAVQTVTTVGYGDNVPESRPGQFVAATVMLLGIGFVTVITAAITGSFVERTRRQNRGGTDGPTEAQVEDIIARLERIEQSLRR